MTAPKLTDIAKRAGVSVAAVSIALNNQKTTRVGAAKRDLIHRIAEDLGYTPNVIAKALAERRTRLLGLAVPLGDPIFFNQFVAQAGSGIQSTLMKRGYNLLVYSPTGREGRATRQQTLESKFIDGLIFVNTRSCTTRDINETINQLEASNIKFTMINSYYGRASINYVGVDDTAIGEEAMRYLAGRGHKRIAFLSGAATLPAHIRLLQGLKRSAAAARIALPPEYVGCTNYDQSVAFKILDGWFEKRGERPTAIFTADDTLLEHTYDYAEARRLKIPDDVAVLARVNTAGSGSWRPRPTAFHIPAFEMGKLAAELLIDSIEKPVQTRQRILLPFTFSEGQTT